MSLVAAYPQYSQVTGQVNTEMSYSMRLELLTNATVVDDAIRFVSTHKIESKVKPNDIDVLYNLDTQIYLSSESKVESIKAQHYVLIMSLQQWRNIKYRFVYIDSA